MKCLFVKFGKKKYKLVVINSCKLYFFLKNNIDVDKKKGNKIFCYFYGYKLLW